MLRLYIIPALRNLKRDKLFAAINTFGLALGLTISFIIITWVSSELRYDKFNKDYEQIYRIIEEDAMARDAACSPAVKTSVLENIPEIEYSARIFKCSQFGVKNMVEVDHKIFTEDEVFFTDQEFFNIFSFPLIRGDLHHVFQKPNAVVITEQTAKKYFGEDDPVGKTLLFSGSTLLEISGVLKDLPPDSHFHFDLLVSMKSHPWGNYLNECQIGSGWMFNTYFKTFPGSSPMLIREKINRIAAELIDKQSQGYKINLELQPLADIHLKSDAAGELEANNDIRYIYIFSSIAVIVIFIAGINYVNLATAYSFGRKKDVGIRKVLGAHKGQVVFQYLTEALITSISAMAISVILIELFQPVFLSITGITYTGIHQNLKFLLVLAGMALITGFFSGIIPSFILSSFQPVNALKPGTHGMDKRSGLRKLLVVFQFIISLILITGTAVIYKQIKYMQNKKLGYNQDHVIVMYIGYAGIQSGNLKNALLSDSRITGVTEVSSLPEDIRTAEYIDTPDGKAHSVWYTSVDRDFFKTMGIHIIRGNDRIENLLPEQYMNKYVMNQAAMEEIGWKEDEALEQKISIRHGNMKPGPVIGIIEDFHFQSLHSPIQPLILEFEPGDFQYMLVRIKGENMKALTDQIKSYWIKTAGDIPFAYSFLDQDYEQLYKSEMKTGKLFMVFALTSTLIAMLGLFGLASYAAFKRTKEIGIRKVFGASVADITGLFLSDYSKLVFISFLIASPISWFIMDRWLEEFAYRIAVDPALILLTGLTLMMICLFTVGYHSLRASYTDPGKTLRYE